MRVYRARGLRRGAVSNIKHRRAVFIGGDRRQAKRCRCGGQQKVDPARAHSWPAGERRERRSLRGAFVSIRAGPRTMRGGEGGKRRGAGPVVPSRRETAPSGPGSCRIGEVRGQGLALPAPHAVRFTADGGAQFRQGSRAERPHPATSGGNWESLPARERIVRKTPAGGPGLVFRNFPGVIATRGSSLR